MDLTFIVVLVIALALFFDFTNGFHDTANAMATPIATGAIKPRTAVALAAILNLVGAFLSTEVAKTISGGIIREGEGGVSITPELIFAGLLGAVLWNLFTWLLGLPSSSSHALFGGLIGAAVVGTWGFDAVDFAVVLSKVILPAILAPAIAGGVAYLCTKLAYGITRRTDPDSGDKLVQKRGGFRYGQIFSSSLVALAHGTNDAQKTMGVITLVLIASGLQTAGTGPHLWVVAACAVAIAAGTYAGGWRIIRTLGSGLTDVKPAQGFAAETSTAAAILASSHLGFALSTTHVASGSVIGSGLGRTGSTVRWGAIGKIGLAWLFTLPAAAIVGGLAAWLASPTHGFGTTGLVVSAVIGLAAMVFIFILSQRETVDHSNAVSEVDAVGEAVHIPSKKERERLAARARLAEKAAAKAAAKAAEMADIRAQALAAVERADTAALIAMTAAAERAKTDAREERAAAKEAKTAAHQAAHEAGGKGAGKASGKAAVNTPANATKSAIGDATEDVGTGNVGVGNVTDNSEDKA
ncbi:inorganic phosphate transporter [Arthrobacter sp. 35W]|uniref:inorganic phosphate transporter n=1 Tax=Arthrobacter sp. 35W TaxID=1132441 RepID=UPI000425FF99|nr:inorganic phosphate transporter [Arthrobacter sp. 35W]